MRCSQASDVLGISGGNDRRLELERCRHDEGVHGTYHGRN
jgi:hypothetical protein